MIDRKKYMREYYQKNKHKYKQRRPSYRGALIIYSAPRITSSPLQHRTMAGDGVAEEYAEAMNEMVAATNAAEMARDLAVQERDVARAQQAQAQAQAQAQEEQFVLVCIDCGLRIIRNSEQHDHCQLLNDGEDLVCEDCATQRPDGDFFGGDDDDDAEPTAAAENAGADAAERLRANGCLDLMVLVFIVLFTICWCFFYAGAYDLLALLLLLVMTIVWCL